VGAAALIAAVHMPAVATGWSARATFRTRSPNEHILNSTKLPSTRPFLLAFICASTIAVLLGRLCICAESCGLGGSCLGLLLCQLGSLVHLRYDYRQLIKHCASTGSQGKKSIGAVTSSPSRADVRAQRTSGLSTCEPPMLPAFGLDMLNSAIPPPPLTPFSVGHTPKHVRHASSWSSAPSLLSSVPRGPQRTAVDLGEDAITCLEGASEVLEAGDRPAHHVAQLQRKVGARRREHCTCGSPPPGTRGVGETGAPGRSTAAEKVNQMIVGVYHHMQAKWPHIATRRAGS